MQAPRRRPMQIYLETASREEVREALAWRVIDGVLTSPTLLAREGGDPADVVLELLEHL